jgi:hypothetical protein
LYGLAAAALGALLVYTFVFADFFPTEVSRLSSTTPGALLDKVLPPPEPKLDKDAYNAKLLFLAHINTASSTYDASTTTPKGITLLIPPTATTTVAAAKALWPAGTGYPNPGALLPEHRIVAYYGNFYSTAMGVLGEYEPDAMLAKLAAAVAEWNAADPSTPVIPAIDYIVVTAQGSAGADGTYRARMPDSQIDKALDLAKRAGNGIVILDVQVGLSNVQTEVPLLDAYLSMPNVHLALDPEFAMHGGARPGTVIGSLDAQDVNWAAEHLAELVRANHLPPKVLVVHRFTQNMVTNAERIKPLPEVQVVIDMDGWGPPAKKVGTYTYVVAPEPVQFTGFKLFYKNDLKPPSSGMMTPAEVLELTPSPSFIQYQ